MGTTYRLAVDLPAFCPGATERVTEKLLIHATSVGTAGNQLVIHELSKTPESEVLASRDVVASL
jgi:hypothetical protein